MCGRILTVCFQAQKASERLLLEWENVTYAVKNKKILTDVSGRVEAGEMLASALSPLCASSHVVLTRPRSHGPVWGGQVHHPGRDIQAQCPHRRIRACLAMADGCAAN